MDEVRVHPETLAGDPFAAAGDPTRECACYDGVHYIGRMVESPHDLDGEVLVQEAVPCRRCREEL